MAQRTLSVGCVMGYGDELIATGLARGAKARGKRIAFGDGRNIVWSPQSYELFRDNPNIAAPGSERDADVEWVPHYRGRRLYGRFDGQRWHFVDFQCPPGELFFSAEELRFADSLDLPSDGFAVIEPRVKPSGACAGANKQWPVDRYAKLSVRLAHEGLTCIQFVPNGMKPLFDGPFLHTPSFRHALAVLSRASLYIGPEGGLHHGCAAVGTDAVVIWGGFNTPKSTGYPWHHNIVAGDGNPCGSVAPCDHCKKGMESIAVDHVFQVASLAWKKQLAQKAS